VHAGQYRGGEVHPPSAAAPVLTASEDLAAAGEVLVGRLGPAGLGGEDGQHANTLRAGGSGRPAPPAACHDLTGSYRQARVHERTREVQRLHKLLEDAGLELGGGALAVLGVSGRAVLGALVGGTTDPEAPSVLARGQRVPAIAVSSA
jgi:hypothetical protein